MCVGITGGTGTLGKILQERLQARNISFSLYHDRVEDPVSVKEWLREVQPRYLIHLAALVPVNRVQVDPVRAFQVNVGGVVYLLDACKQLSLRPWFFYASSSHVYRSQPLPLSENSPCDPLSLYGTTKRMGEQVVEFCGSSLEIPWCIGRIFSFYHVSQTASFLYPTLLRRFQEEDLAQPFGLYGAEDIRDLSPAESIVEKIISVLQARLCGVFNIGSGKGIKISDFVQSIAPRTLTVKNLSQVPSSVLIADTSKLEQALQD